ncbi:MAG: hypothetical protein ABEJ26_13015 [Halosimplex sp.]
MGTRFLSTRWRAWIASFVVLVASLFLIEGGAAALGLTTGAYDLSPAAIAVLGAVVVVLAVAGQRLRGVSARPLPA